MSKGSPLYIYVYICLYTYTCIYIRVVVGGMESFELIECQIRNIQRVTYCKLYIHIYIYIYEYLYSYTYVCIYICTYIYVYIYIYNECSFLYIDMYAYIISMYKNKLSTPSVYIICVDIFTCLYFYTYMYIYIYIQWLLISIYRYICTNINWLPPESTPYALAGNKACCVSRPIRESEITMM
jgi:hypothetical protein